MHSTSCCRDDYEYQARAAYQIAAIVNYYGFCWQLFMPLQPASKDDDDAAKLMNENHEHYE